MKGSNEKRIPNLKIPTFLHVSKALLQLVIYLWTKGKVIHKNNTARQTEKEIF